MKLNYDCFRNVLLALKDFLTYDNIGQSYNLQIIDLSQLLKSPYLKNFSKIDVVYSCQKLIEANFIEAKPDYLTYKQDEITNIHFKAITYTGHQYLDSVRNDKIWQNIKDIVTQKGVSLTVDSILITAKNLITKLINN